MQREGLGYYHIDFTVFEKMVHMYAKSGRRGQGSRGECKQEEKMDRVGDEETG